MTTDDNFSDVLNDEDIGNGCSALADEISPEAVRICVIATGLPAKVRELTQMVEGFQMEGKRLRAELEAARRDAELLRKSIDTAKVVMKCARDLNEEIFERGTHELHGRLFSAFCKYDSLFGAAIAKERSSHGR